MSGALVARWRRAERILDEVAAETGVDIETMRKPDARRAAVNVRRIFCVRAKAAGIGSTIMAALIERDATTVLSMTNPEMRARKMKRYRAWRSAASG
jgi:hypothetical protein